MTTPTNQAQSSPPLSRGLVSIFTGNGKGKTTAALGTALRAAGYGLKVFIVFFMKGNGFSHSEIYLLKQLENVTAVNFGQTGWIDLNSPAAEAIDQAREAFSKAREAVISANYDLVVLDELNPATYFGLIPLEDVLTLIRDKPEELELILTGRYALPELIRAADLVTEMRMIKHPYYSGILARQGIDY